MYKRKRKYKQDKKNIKSYQKEEDIDDENNNDIEDKKEENKMLKKRKIRKGDKISNFNQKELSIPTRYEDHKEINSVKIIQRLGEWDARKFIIGEEDEDIFKTIVFFGQRRTGKSFAARDVLFQVKDLFKRGVVITGTKRNGFWQEIVPDNCVIPLEYMNHAIKLILEVQTKAKQDMDEGKLDPSDYPFFVVLEDFIQNMALARYNNLLNELFVAGRHSGMLVLALTQYPKAVSTYVRDNLDAAIIFKQNNMNQVDNLVTEHFGFIDKKYAYSLLNTITSNKWTSLVVNKTPYQDNDNEKYKKFLAKDPLNGKPNNKDSCKRLGCDEYWDMNEKNKSHDRGNTNRTFEEIQNDLLTLCYKANTASIFLK